ncbi:hypothetical protein GCM10009785_00650 [Brooklawnia cerclae]|uniref:Uncharacterized protein n=1 Tax=Brooklawnia cerclae TaxID=349934 RepID=A0ABX0SEG3_9ACTN|nr:Rv3235 family protein [Brooklawnia cerclae]NIH56341.1 hypothetical protein [Brooklawnia cerclae]
MPTMILEPRSDGWLDLLDEPAHSRPPTIPVPDVATRLARHIALALLEALAGRRPSTQFSAWLPPKSWHTLNSWVRDNRADPARLASIRLVRDPNGHVDAVIRYETSRRSLVATAVLTEGTSGWCCAGLAVLWPGSRTR